MVGIVCGTYSSVCLACAFWYILSESVKKAPAAPALENADKAKKPERISKVKAESADINKEPESENNYSKVSNKKKSNKKKRKR